MALTISNVKVEPNASGGTPGNSADLKSTYTSVTLDSTAYATNGLSVITPAVLGLNVVMYGICSIRTANASAVGEAVLDTSVNGTPAAPKLKLNIATGELANAATTQSGVVVDILAYGY